MARQKESKADKKDAPKGKKEEELATLAEIASMLRMSPVQVRKMAQSRQIPAVKVDGEWRFNKDLVRQAVHNRSRGRLT